MSVTDVAEAEEVKTFSPRIVLPVALFPVPVFPSMTNLIPLTFLSAELET